MTLGQFGFGFTVSESFPLFLEGYVGLHRAELATVLVMQGGPVRRGAVAGEPCDLTDIAPSALHLLGLPPDGMEGRPLAAAWDAAADVPPVPELLALPRGFVLEVRRPAAGGRLYPKGLRRDPG